MHNIKVHKIIVLYNHHKNGLNIINKIKININKIK